MAKLTSKIAIPIILVGIFAIAVFLAISYEQLQPSFYIIIIFFVIYVFFFGLAIGQSLTSPIKKLLDRATELSEGNLSSRVYLETKDEFAELGRAFNKIAEELESSSLQKENTEKSVGVKVKARTQELEETINSLEQKVRNRTAELQNVIKTLEKFQNESTSKEIEVSELKKRVESLEGDVDSKQRTKVSNLK